MKADNFRRIILPILIFIFTGFFVHGCGKSGFNASGEKMENNSIKIQSISDRTKTICFGRVIIKVPYDAIVVFGPAEADSDIEYIKDGAGDVDNFISSRLRQIEKERKFLDEEDLAKLPRFGEVINGSRPEQKTVIGSKDQVGYAILSLLLIEKSLFIQNANGVLPQHNFIERVNQVANNLRLRDIAEIPAEPGICVEGGFVTGVYEYERATIGIRFKEFPDVHLSVDVHKNLEFLNNDSNPKMLHERARESAEAAGLGGVFSRTRILRDQVRQIGHWKGQEMAFRTPAYKKGKSVHEIRFYSAGSINDPFHPQLDIRLYSGVKDNQKAAVEPSITDEQALALWDMLVSTIRLREASDATPPKVNKTPLAALVGTGKICPESGWWETNEKHVANDGRRLFVRAGELMPSADTSIGTGIWQKIFGGDRLKISTTWRLADYVDESVIDDPVRTMASPLGQIDCAGDRHA